MACDGCGRFACAVDGASEPERREDLETTGYLELSKLKGNVGNQNYVVPDSVDAAGQRSVVIYCRPFHMIFSVATLMEPGA